MISDKTMQDIASRMSEENIQALITELGSYKQDNKNKDEVIATLHSRLDAFIGKVGDEDADPDYKPLVYRDHLIIKDRRGYYSFRTMNGAVIPDFDGKFTGTQKARQGFDAY